MKDWIPKKENPIAENQCGGWTSVACKTKTKRNQAGEFVSWWPF